MAHLELGRWPTLSLVLLYPEMWLSSRSNAGVLNQELYSMDAMVTWQVPLFFHSPSEVVPGVGCRDKWKKNGSCHVSAVSAGGKR